MTDSKPYRWGIIGCGLIAPRFFQALEKSGEGQVVAAASKSMRRARRFRQKTGVEQVYTSYEAMLDREKPDAVYIATTHNFHAENARLCIERGIPVLIEKAFTQNARQAEDLISKARKKKLFMMEAMWTRFTPAAVKLRELLAEGIIGDIQTLEGSFCVRMHPFSPKMRPWNRMYSPKLAGGALLDIGIYPIAYARMVFGRPPGKISSSALMAFSGVDKTSAYTFEYPNGARAEMRSSFVEDGSRDMIITGTKGRILIPAFYRADHFTIHSNEHPEKEVLCPDPTFEFQIREVHRCLNEGLPESPLMPLDETLETMQTLDTIRAQWNMTYPGE